MTARLLRRGAVATYVRGALAWNGSEVTVAPGHGRFVARARIRPLVTGLRRTTMPT